VATPLAVELEVNEPPPVTDQVTPELAPSFATVAVKAWVAPPIIALGLVGLIATVTGLSVIVAVVDLVGSLMLVAVRVTVVTAAMTVVGALYVTPVMEDAVSVPTPLPMLQLTPELEPSFATVSVKACEPLLPRLAVAGLIGLTLMGVRVTVAVPVLVGSVLLVAVTVAEVVVMTAGAV